MQQTLNDRVGFDSRFFAEVFAPGCPDYTEHQEAKLQAGVWLDDFLKAMSNEMEELRDCTYWKHWCTEAQQGRRYEIKDVESARKECIDLLHFWISIAQALGMTPEMVCSMYASKLNKNIKRQEDGYSIEVKDKAWELFTKYPFDAPGCPPAWDRNVQSLEDLPNEIAAYYVEWAKRI
jgi:hypothetical protein